jgi:hypothetical protein
MTGGSTCGWPEISINYHRIILIRAAGRQRNRYRAILWADRQFTRGSMQQVCVLNFIVQTRNSKDCIAGPAEHVEIDLLSLDRTAPPRKFLERASRRSVDALSVFLHPHADLFQRGNTGRRSRAIRHRTYVEQIISALAHDLHKPLDYVTGRCIRTRLSSERPLRIFAQHRA